MTDDILRISGASDKRPDSLIIRGPFRGLTGYDQLVREFAGGLIRKGIGVTLIDFPEWSRDKLQGLEESRFTPSELSTEVADTALHFMMPHQVQAIPKKININFTMFEASRIPRRWARLNGKHQGVIVPTISSRDAWLAGGYPEERLHLCPLGIHGDREQLSAEPLALGMVRGKAVSAYRCRFLNVSHISPRKNLVNLIRVWIESTTRDDDAILIVKWDCPWPSLLNKFFYDLRLMQWRLGKTEAEAAPVCYLINRKFSEGDMPKLYRSASHYWSMSNGEGWDLCTMQAGAAGLALIAPDHSSYRDYLDTSLATLIPATTVPARFIWNYSLMRLFAGLKWWQPDNDMAKSAIRQAIDQPPDSEQIRRAMHHFKTNFSWDKATERLIETVANIQSRF